MNRRDVDRLLLQVHSNHNTLDEKPRHLRRMAVGIALWHYRNAQDYDIFHGIKRT